MKYLIDQQYRTNPLAVIVLCALFIRLLAAFFSEGYAFHDDHFCVTRVAQSWAEGIPHWLADNEPPKHSMLYAAANAVFLWLLGATGIDDPVVKTTVLRVIHSFYSLLVITLSFKITERLSDRRNAIMVGWLLALLWFMPYLSVKFLAELVCVPPVLGAFLLILKTKRIENHSLFRYLFAGALLGLAFTIRMHTILFAGALGLVLLFDKRWKESVIFTVGYLFVAGLIIGIPDAIFYDYPFHYVVDYFAFNSENAYNYVSGSPFKFLFTAIGFLVPPISLFLIWGFVRKGWQISFQIFLAVTIFFVFHSSFPNQQERFILPIYPLLIIVGTIGWNDLKDGSRFWQNKRSFYRGLWIFFWSINIIVALALALTYTKKDRIAPLHYLYGKKDVTSVLIEGSSVKQPPVFYLGENCIDFTEFEKDALGMGALKAESLYMHPEYKFVFTLSKSKGLEELKEEFNSVGKEPNYVILKGGDDLEKRLKRLNILFPDKRFSFEKVIFPSNYDQLLHYLNPRIHKNTEAYIFKIENGN